MESSLAASSLRIAVVLKVLNGATAVAVRKLAPARLAVLKVERANRDILSECVDDCVVECIEKRKAWRVVVVVESSGGEVVVDRKDEGVGEVGKG
jgi:hypothetical protein